MRLGKRCKNICVYIGSKYTNAIDILCPISYNYRFLDHFELLRLPECVLGRGKELLAQESVLVWHINKLRLLTQNET